MPNSHRSAHHTDLYKDVQKMKDLLSQTAYDVKDRAGEIWQQSLKDVKEKSSDVEESVTGYIQENPIKTVAFSMVAGMILAKLFRK